MSTKLEELRQEKADVLKSLEEIDAKAKEESRPYNDDEIVRMDSGTERVQSIEREIETLTRSDNLKALLASKKSQVFGAPVIKVNHRHITNEDRNNAMKAFLCAGKGQFNQDKYMRAAELLNVDPDQKELYVRAQSTDTTGSEGEDFLSDISSGIDQAMKNFGRVESVANMNVVDRANNFHWVLYDDTSHTSSKLAQNAGVSGTEIEFVPLDFRYASYKTGITQVSLESIEDIPNLVGILNSALGERQARRLASEYVDGTSASGAAGIGGFLHEADEVDADSTSGGIVMNDLLKLFGEVDADYRDNNESCVWTMNDDTWIYLLQNLQTDDGKSLLGDFINGPQGRLLGHKVVICNSMGGLDGTNESDPVAFGDMSRYYISRTPVRLVRTDDAGNLAVNLYTYVRATAHTTTLGNALKKLHING